MRDASKMSQTIGVSSARFFRNVAGAGNSCVPKTWFAKRILRSLFHQLPFWLSAFRLILSGSVRSLDLDSSHCRSDAQLGDRVWQELPNAPDWQVDFAVTSVKMIQVLGSCESNVKGALDTTRSTRLLTTITSSEVSKLGSATFFAKITEAFRRTVGNSPENQALRKIT